MMRASSELGSASWRESGDSGEADLDVEAAIGLRPDQIWCLVQRIR